MVLTAIRIQSRGYRYILCIQFTSSVTGNQNSEPLLVCDETLARDTQLLSATEWLLTSCLALLVKYTILRIFWHTGKNFTRKSWCFGVNACIWTWCLVDGAFFRTKFRMASYVHKCLVTHFGEFACFEYFVCSFRYLSILRYLTILLGAD